MTGPTVTRGTAPTEEEIRAILVQSACTNEGHREPLLDARLSDVMHWADGGLDWSATMALDMDDDERQDWREDPHRERAVWCDLRPSEARRLRALLHEAHARAIPRLKAIILDELTAVGVRFAQEYPEAPRPS